MRKCAKLNLMITVFLITMLVFALVVSAGAEAATAKDRALEEVRAAIKALPPHDKLTEADRPAVLEARRLADRVMAQYGLSEYDICALAARLAAAESAVGLGFKALALPPTGGGMAVAPFASLVVLSGLAMLVVERRRG